MKTYDLDPLSRSGIGFDRMMDALQRADRVEDQGYPAYDIARIEENSFRITLLVPGFSAEELSVETHESVLSVTANPKPAEVGHTYLRRGIGLRGFTRTFQLADHVKVSHAKLENGLLIIDLNREVPDALKPRKIEIVTTPDSGVRSIGHQDAA